MSNIYFTSDTHYNHENIASKNCSKWKTGYRDYDSLKEMNEDIVKNFNKTLKEDDTLYHLGDWSFGGINSIYDFYKQLRCKNIHLITGNHDDHIVENRLLPNCQFTSIDTIIDGFPQRGCEVWANNLFLSVNQVKTVKIGHDTFFLSHYPHLSWLHASKGVIMLHGHEHGVLNYLNENVKRLDVGIDSAKIILGEYRPFHVDEVRNIVKKKGNLILGHHKGQE